MTQQPTISPFKEALALLVPLPPVQRARVLSALLDGHNTKRLKALRVQAVFEATRAPHATYETVAQQLGVSKAAVNKAVTQHRRSLSAFEYAHGLLQHAVATGEPADFQETEDALRAAGAGVLADAIHTARAEGRPVMVAVDEAYDVLGHR